MNYASLTAQIQSYADRTDAAFVGQIPNFIDQGINRIYSEAKNIGFEIVVAGNFVIGTFEYAKPANWKETISFQYVDPITNNITFLLPRNLEFCKSYWPTPAVHGTPLFYADFIGYTNFYIAPTPAAANAFQIVYLGLPLFNAENPTNFLTERYPSLLLYACLVETIPFLKDDERTPIFEGLYNRALQSINKDALKLYTDRTSRRDKD